MKYSELIQPAEPLETVKQIRESGTVDAARRDVETFVISDRMASLLVDVLFPNLQYDHPSDQKGILTVATYGTGKTHLMSVVAGVAEFPELVDALTNEAVRQAAVSIAGRFKVIRFEIGSSTLPLREIMAKELARGLATLGVDFTFPDWATVTNTKDALTDMMAGFEAVYPDHGLLFVLDEMLEFLRARRNTEVIQDLVFLREVGEICRSTRFRFISGVQEAIFESAMFEGVAETIRRVQDRFEQVRISKEDVAFVVEQRLLRKDATQRARIAEYLQPFTPLYEGMAERLDQFIALFPVHPDYLKTFEEITSVQKREVLRTIEKEVGARLDEDVPTDTVGLICADSYWVRLADDPGTRTIEDVRTVLERTDVLRNKVEAGLAEKQYLETALRIIDGLAVHRLTTGDIRRPIGMTPSMLRDELCLLPPGLPERDALFLATTVESIVRKILTAVNGQFVSIDPDTGQIYLDIDKDIDYEQQIVQRADSLDDFQLDEAYYLAMEEALGQRDTPYVAGYRIWEYPLPWPATNADRKGYLFMGAPNERSTAQPPRDFYVYFLQPYDPPDFTNEERPDEVFVELHAPPTEFTNPLRRYAGATAKAKESTATHRSAYEDLARRALQEMVTWLRDNMSSAMSVTYRGEQKPLGSWLAAVPGERGKVQDQIDAVAASALSDHFAARYPGYPRFPRRITPSTLEADVRVALTQIATRRSTHAGTAILEALELVDMTGSELRADGTYAAELSSVMDAAKEKVVNRSDMLAPLDGDPAVLAWGPWHLEPVWLVVVAAALCQQGKLEISVGGKKIDALGLDHLVRLDPEQLATFDHFAPPKALPVTQLRKVAELLDIASGAVADTGATEAFVREVLTRVADMARRTDKAIVAVSEGTQLWGEQLFDLIDERLDRLEKLKALLADLKVRDSVGKMNSLAIDPAAFDEAAAGRSELDRVEDVAAARDKLGGVADYLREAHGVFGAGVDESKDALGLRSDMIELLRETDGIDPTKVVTLRNAGEDIRRRYADLASRSYRHDNLDAAGDARKRDLLEGLIAVLDSLQAVSILAAGPLAQLRSDLTEIRTVVDIDEAALAKSVVLAGHNPPRPIDGLSAAARLEDCERRANELVSGWTDTLSDSLAEPEMAEQIGYLPEGEPKVEVEKLAATRTLPEPVTPAIVTALNQVFDRVDIHHLTPSEITGALFPDTSPATLEQMRERLDALLTRAVGSTQPEKVRFLPAEEPS